MYDEDEMVIMTNDAYKLGSQTVLKDLKEKFDLLVAKEINIARTDGFPTSRLTSLAVKFYDIINKLDK